MLVRIIDWRHDKREEQVVADNQQINELLRLFNAYNKDLEIFDVNIFDEVIILQVKSINKSGVESQTYIGKKYKFLMERLQKWLL